MSGAGAPRSVWEVAGALSDGRLVHRIRLQSPTGISADVLTLGAIVSSLCVPDASGQRADVVLGYDSVEGYLADPAYVGAVVGRFANRIARGRFSLDGDLVALACNDGAHHLHGGPAGFHRALWAAEPFASPDEAGVLLRYRSPDGDEGYPGTLDVALRVSLTVGGALCFDATATTDRPTVVSLSHHGYFNLAGAGDVSGHEVGLSASRYLPVDAGLIPTGEQRAVAGTRFDLRRPRVLGEAAFDHCFVVDGDPGVLRPAATLRDPGSGRAMAVWTTAPGLQLYTGEHLDGRAGKGGRPHHPRAALCLEAEAFPDAPNQPGFPSVVLRPGDVWRQRTAYRFGSP